MITSHQMKMASYHTAVESDASKADAKYQH